MQMYTVRSKISSRLNSKLPPPFILSESPKFRHAKNKVKTLKTLGFRYSCGFRSWGVLQSRPDAQKVALKRLGFAQKRGKNKTLGFAQTQQGNDFPAPSLKRKTPPNPLNIEGEFPRRVAGSHGRRENSRQGVVP